MIYFFLFCFINRNDLAWFTTIFAAEKLLKVVPEGTHEYEKYITPEELFLMAKDNSMNHKKTNGMFYNPLTKKWTLTSELAQATVLPTETSVNYISHFQKEE